MLAPDSGIGIDNEAIKYVSIHFSKNVRELEGAFNKVCAFAELSKQDITLQLAKEILKCKENEESLNFDKINGVVSAYYNIETTDVKGTARSQNIALARQLSMYLCRELTNQSFESIGEFFSKKHTTAMYAYNQIKSKIKTEKELSNAVREIKQALKVV